MTEKPDSLHNDKSACYGLMCHKRATCQRYHAVERRADGSTGWNAPWWTIDTCGPGEPLYLHAKAQTK